MLTVGKGGEMRIEATIGMLALLAGCPGSASMGQFGEEEDLRCEPTSRTPVLPEDTVEIGYVDELNRVLVADLLALPAGDRIETLQWSDATETPVTVGLANARDPELVTYEYASDGHETEDLAGVCPTQLEFTVDVTLNTDDGRMNDVFEGAVHTLGERVYVEHRITDPGGTIDVEALAQPGVTVEPDEVRVSIWLAPDGSEFAGSLLPQPIGGIDDDAHPLGKWPAGWLEE